jgi:hypothetical protein
VVVRGVAVFSVPTTGTSFAARASLTPHDLDRRLTPNNTRRSLPGGRVRPANSRALAGIGTSVAGQLRDVTRISQQWNLTISTSRANWLVERPGLPTRSPDDEASDLNYIR